MSFAYSGGLLSTVTDTLGRTITYEYYDYNRLKDVVDFNGRKVDFTYFTGNTGTGNTDDLQDIGIEHGSGADNVQFQYTASGGLYHEMTQIFDATQGQPYVTNTYDGNGMVASQIFGSGTLNYTYTLSGSSVVQNTVVDGLGNKTVYNYDQYGNKSSAEYYNQAQTGSTTYTYGYNSNGYMVSKSEPRGNGTAYDYDARGNLIKKSERENITLSGTTSEIVTTYTYNNLNQVITETRPNNLSFTNTYDASGNVLTTTASGVTTYS